MIKTIYRIFIIALLLSNFACSDDFLEKYPEDVLTDEVFFTEEVHLKDYVAQLYAKAGNDMTAMVTGLTLMLVLIFGFKVRD